MSNASGAVVQPFSCMHQDHVHCLSDALARAEAISEQRGLRLTRLRRQVLELVWASHMPVKAYDLLDQLRLEHAAAAPPTVYRALDFLVEQGFVHRIESLNAYIGCDIPERDHQGQFLICEKCGIAAELRDPEIAAVLHGKAEKMGFRLDVSTVEMKGRCARCEEDSTTATMPV